MSAAYKKKAETYKNREPDRNALKVVKELFKRYSSCDIKKNMYSVKNASLAILKSRFNDIMKDTPDDQTDTWYENFAKELCCGLFERANTYVRILDKLTKPIVF